ncbi:MAG: mannose-1-phosphate guanylyltransferase [Myxococcaceae bacterium]|nr:mannose-1-phosphate guanylyltransferase [Myxococcaceae bacterium]MCI0672396.1 mannose-1-phosphate guanylyltransferase [Myxococcaceae bacterium]
MNLYPVIMAGGSGTRFWPLSRKARPKQFLPLASNQPLIVDTVTRLKGLASPKDTLVVCGPLHAPSVRKLVKGLPKANLLVEPVARNTAPAIALAALHVARRDPAGILVVLPSDHHVADLPGFRATLERAAAVAAQGLLVTIGIQPSHPETGYGYIRLGEALPQAGARKVAAFVEKPDAATARSYLASGEYLWNGGIFLFRADAILEAFRKHMPDLAKGLDKLAPKVGKRDEAATLERLFPKFPSTSIDYGVMEKADNIAVVPGDFGWSDVGSFGAIPEVRPADARGNVVSGKGAVVVDCDGCVVLADGRPLAVVGLKDVVVVDSGDAILVVPREKAQDVRKAVDALKERRLEKYL